MTRTGRYNEDVPALEAEVERLRAALKPFADAADFFTSHRSRITPDQILFQHETIGAKATITLADLQAAKAAVDQ